MIRIHSSDQNEHVDEEENSDDNDDDDDDDDDVTTYVYDLDHPPPESRPYVCPVCDKRYAQKYFLIVHMDIHNYEKKFECNICKEKFWLQSHLLKHRNTNCGRDVSPVHEIPPHRRKPSAKQSGNAAREKKVGDSKRDNKDDGKDCARHVKSSSASSKSPPNIRRDVSPVHEIPPHRRKPSAKQSGNAAREKKVGDSKRDKKDDGKDCTRHVKGSTASSKNPPNIRRELKTYSCPECYRGFTQKGNLTTHLRIHSGEKMFECRVCSKAFSRKHNLTSHLRIHTGEKPYECEVCNESFTLKHHLTDHLRIHTGEKPFECGVCEKSFSCEYHLTRHLRIHTGEKPYECGVCKKAFRHSSTSTRHLRIHTGEKPFACDICKKTFRRKEYIRRHMNIHIPNSKRIYKCKVCKKVFHQRHILSEHRKDHEVEN